MPRSFLFNLGKVKYIIIRNEEEETMELYDLQTELFIHSELEWLEDCFEKLIKKAYKDYEDRKLEIKLENPAMLSLAEPNQKLLWDERV